MIQLPAVARSREISEGAAGGLVGVQGRARRPCAGCACVAPPATEAVLGVVKFNAGVWSEVVKVPTLV